MLTLGSRTLNIDGITVYADHADPNQFWYLPGPVKISRQPNQQAAFTLIKYKPAAVEAGVKGGGFLMFGVDLRLTPEQERRILSRLSAVAPGTPQLAAVPFSEGTVECMALNLQGSGGTVASPAGPGSFNAVEKILGATIPSLDVNNAAHFGLTLSQEGTTILERAFQQGTTPVGVLYNLKYAALRPALDVKITADLKRVYDHFSASLSGQYYFVKVGIEAGFEKLVQEGAIKIEVINYSDASDRAEKEKWALDFFKDNLLQSWFTPSLTPGQFAGGRVSPPTEPANPGSGASPGGSAGSGGSGTATPDDAGDTDASGSGGSSGSSETGNSAGASGAGGPAAANRSTPASSTAAPAAGQGAAAPAHQPAQMEMNSIPNPLPQGYGLVHTPAAAGTTETLTVQGATSQTVVRVNGAVRSLDANNQFTVEVTSSAPAEVIVEYPQTTVSETFHLFFDFDKPAAGGWSTSSTRYNSYLSNTPNPRDDRFISSDTNRSTLTITPGRHTTGNANQLRAWAAQLAMPRTVQIEGYASYEGDANKAPHNLSLSQRRRQVAVGIVSPLVTSVSGSAAGQGHARAAGANRSGDERDRVAEITGQVVDRPRSEIRARLTRAAAPAERPETPETPQAPETPETPETSQTPETPETPRRPEEPDAIAGDPTISFKLKYIRQEEQKTVTFHYNRAEAVQRTYAPQSLIGLLLADLNQAEKHFVEVDLDDPFFRVLRVSVDAPIDFQRIGLTAAQVALDYGDPAQPHSHKHAEFIFEPNIATRQLFEVFLNQRFDTAYTYSVQYHFDPGSGWEGHAFSYSLPPQQTEDRSLQINPFEHLGFLEVRAFPNRIDWGVIESIDVHLAYTSPTGWQRQKTLTVIATSAEQFWRLRLDRPEARTYSYHCIYHLKDGSTQRSESVESNAPAVPVNDPFEGALDLEFVPLFAPGAVRQVYVDVQYADPENQYQREERLIFTGDAIAPLSLRLALKNPARRAYQYRLTIIGTDNSLRRLPPVTTEETIIGVSETGHR